MSQVCSLTSGIKICGCVRAEGLGTTNTDIISLVTDVYFTYLFLYKSHFLVSLLVFSLLT